MVADQFDDQIAINTGCDVWRQNQAAVRHASNRSDRSLNIGAVFDFAGNKLDAQRLCQGASRLLIAVNRGCLGVAYKPYELHRGRDLFGYSKPLADDTGFRRQQTSEISAGMREILGKADGGRIANADEYDRYRAARMLHRSDVCKPVGEDYFRLQGNQLLRDAASRPNDAGAKRIST